MADVPIDAGDRPLMQGFLDAFAGWLDRQYLQPTVNSSAVWSSSRLSYPAAAAAPGDVGKQLSLSAPRYEGGRLDWYSFEVDAQAAALNVADETHVPPPPTEEVMSFLPVTATFKGMPSEIGRAHV